MQVFEESGEVTKEQFEYLKNWRSPMTCNSPSGKCDQTTCVVSGRCEWPTPAEQWAGEFGNAYTDRNRVDWRKRVPFWQDIMDRTGARSVLEVGCNAGWNMTAIKVAAPWAKVSGIDVNTTAVRRACTAGLDAWLETTEERAYKNAGGYELVFTAGVLIHVSPANIEQTMKDIITLSNRWVLAVEYLSLTETEVLYRGSKDMLWKRPFGDLYQKLGLEMRYVGSLSKDQGFDDCTAWLMEKP